MFFRFFFHFSLSKSLYIKKALLKINAMSFKLFQFKNEKKCMLETIKNLRIGITQKSECHGTRLN